MEFLDFPNYEYQYIRPQIEYLIDYKHKHDGIKVFLYEINHNNKTLKSHEFFYTLDIIEYIVKNKIQLVTFYGVGYLDILKKELENLNIDCSTDREIHKWRMTLPIHIRNIISPLFYYEVQGYKYNNE